MTDVLVKESGSLSVVNLPEIERKLLEFPQDFDCPVHHHFGPGIYIRELRVPAGVIGMGHVQRFAHMNNFVSGRIVLLNDDGSKTELVAPMTFVGKPGRKVVYVIEDMVWQNIYATDETDVEILEQTYLEKSEESEDFYSSFGVSFEESESSRKDFELAISEFGLSADYVHECSTREDDQIQMPFGWFKTCVMNSKIHGKGFFASANFKEGDIIAPAVLSGKRTPASRYTNHSPTPNSKAVVFENGDIFFVALRDISGCKSGARGEEITTDYRIAMQYRQQNKIEVKP